MNVTFTIIRRLRPPRRSSLLGLATGTNVSNKRSLSISNNISNSANANAPKSTAKKSSSEKGKASAKPWNEAACVLAVAPMNNSEPYSLGYLLVERSGTGRVMPGNWVFPGGNKDPTDSDPRWIPLFKEIQNIDILQERFLQGGAKFPEIYYANNDSDDDENPIPKEISLRITAIREMFEEAGILLCKPRKVDKEKHLHNGLLHYEHVELQDRKILQGWQKKVRKKASTFVDLCKELDSVPDVHALYDWSNWLSPTIFKAKSRFDTMNYMVALPKMPRVVIDGNEAVNAQWTSPATILEEHSKGQTRLMPPQLYEMTRLKPLSTMDELQQRLRLRKRLGIERFFPVFRKVKDGTLILLPGDELYPKSPDYIGVEPPVQEISKKTIAQMKETSKTVHRAVASTAGVIESFNINVERFGNIY